MQPSGGTLLPPVSEPSGLAALSLVTLISGAALSGSASLSAVLVAIGLALGAWPVVVTRGDLIVRVTALVGFVWVLYGAMVGSLPDWTDVGRVEDWATTEGRILVSLATIMIASAVRSRSALRWLLVSACVVVTVVHVVALVIYFARWSPPEFPIEVRRLFFGLSSSHHVVSFLSVVVALISLGTGRLMDAKLRWSVLAVALASIFLAGSRTALLGVLAGAVVIAVYRFERRRLWQVLAVGVVALAALVATNDRFRTTAGSLVDPEFFSAAADSFTSADGDVARERSDSEAEANILLRLSFWGEAADHIVDSPIVGMGAFRQNDANWTFSGTPGFVYLATGGDDVFNDSEPHNVILYLLIEVGIVGLLLFSAPYVIAWRRTTSRDAPDDDSGATADDATGDTTTEGAATDHSVVEHVERPDRTTCAVLTRSTIAASLAMSMVSSGVLAAGLGVIANAVIFAGAAVAMTTGLPISDPLPEEVDA